MENQNEFTSIHSANIEDVHLVPIKHLIRPIPSVLNEAKVISLMKTIQVSILNKKKRSLFLNTNKIIIHDSCV